jgi:hypothetical protein
MVWSKFAILTLTLLGFALRLFYLTTAHPFFDEYTTVLAARQILATGLPVLPSGLFYEHGLLSSYLIAPFAGDYLNLATATGPPAYWRLMLPRWPSLLLSTLTIPLIYAIGRRLTVNNEQLAISNGQLTINNGQASNPPILRSSSLPAFQFSNLPWSHAAALFAAGLFALSPEGIVWGGRARMYALATLLVLLVVDWAFRGARSPAPARYRWLALGALLAALLTQFGVLVMLPPLFTAMLVIGWLSCRSHPGQQASAPLAGRQNSFCPWFLRPTVVLEGLFLVAGVGLAVLVKRLGQPLGRPSLGEPDSGGLVSELAGTISYQTTLHLVWADTVKFLARQFGLPHQLWLSLVILAGAMAGLGAWLWFRRRPSSLAAHLLRSPFFSSFNLFLGLIFGLIVVEMVTVLDPFRRNPRYLIMYLPLFYLIASFALFYLIHLGLLACNTLRFTFFKSESTTQHADVRPVTQTLVALGLLIAFTAVGFLSLQVAFETPEPAYEQALAQVQAGWQPGDALLTMNTPAAALYLGQVDGFTVQNEAKQFLLDSPAGPVDRWLGAPWIGSVAAFMAAFNANERVWFVSDTIRLPIYFRGDWQAVLRTQFEPVWAGDNALVYRTRADRQPLPTEPEVLVQSQLGDSIQLMGYTLNPNRLETPQAELTVTLFWRAIGRPAADYTVFLHLRDGHNGIVAQGDSQPLNGAYPTSQWQPGETVIDPLTLALPPDLAPGRYRLMTGLYRLETLARLPVRPDSTGENAVRLATVELYPP